MLALSGFIIVTGAGMFLYLGSLLSQRVGPVAQLGLEHPAHNRVGVGSNPSRPTTYNPCFTVEKPRRATEALGRLRRDNEDIYRFEERLEAGE